jgi:hypothetical protein
MKFRLGFVSNSSSSSFVIAWKPEDIKHCEACGRGHPDPLTLTKNSKYATIICDNPFTKIIEWETEIKECEEIVAKICNLPAMEPYLDPAITFSKGNKGKKEKKEYLTHATKVWQEVSRLTNNITYTKKKIKCAERELADEFKLLWVEVNWSTPEGHDLDMQIQEMEKQGIITFVDGLL